MDGSVGQRALHRPLGSSAAHLKYKNTGLLVLLLPDLPDAGQTKSTFVRRGPADGGVRVFLHLVGFVVLDGFASKN